MKETLRQIEQELEKTKIDLERLKSKKRNLDRESDSIGQKITIKERDVSRLEQELAAKKEELSKLTKEKEDKMREIQDVDKDIGSIEISRRGTQKQMEDITDKLKSELKKAA